MFRSAIFSILVGIIVVNSVLGDEDEKPEVEKNLQAGDFGFDTPVL